MLYYEYKSLKRLEVGTNLLKIFYLSVILDLGAFLYFVYKRIFPWQLISVLVFAELCLFWTGIILVYLTSTQLGVKPRILGIMFGFVPIANLIMLNRIIGICSREIKLEKTRKDRDSKRIDSRICATKYPVLLVHGVFSVIISI